MNAGKKFEILFKSSLPSYCLYYRLIDPPQSFGKNDFLRFSWKNPCDIFLFDSRYGIFYTLELKSTKQKSFTFENINLDNKQPSKMIHKHQILSLDNFSKYNYVVSGFIFNFRYDSTNIEKTYFQNIRDFKNMTLSIQKKSFNEIDLIKNNGIEISGKKKRTNYTWDIDTFLSKQIESIDYKNKHYIKG